MTPPKHSRLSLARRLRLQQLAVFEKVVEAGSILAASDALAMTRRKFEVPHGIFWPAIEIAHR